MLERYAREQGFMNCQFFVDDGYSGMFNPPAEAEIKAMMEEIKADPQRYKFSLTA